MEHDRHVGLLLAKLDELGIAYNNIVMCSTNSRAQSALLPCYQLKSYEAQCSATREGRSPLIARRAPEQSMF